MKKNPIGKYLLQNWYYYVFAFGSMALSVFLDMLAPLVTLHIVDDVLVGHKMELLWKYLAAFLLIGAAKALFQYIKEFLFDVSSVRVASQMRDNLFRHVQRLSVEYFDKNNTGELLARVRDDVDRIWDILGFAGMLILEGLICIMMAMVSMVKTGFAADTRLRGDPSFRRRHRNPPRKRTRPCLRCDQRGKRRHEYRCTGKSRRCPHRQILCTGTV